MAYHHYVHSNTLADPCFAHVVGTACLASCLLRGLTGCPDGSQAVSFSRDCVPCSVSEFVRGRDEMTFQEGGRASALEFQYFMLKSMKYVYNLPEGARKVISRKK